MFDIIIAEDEHTLSECLRMREEVFVHEKKVDPNIERDENDILGGECEHFLITEDGESIGALRCTPLYDTVYLQRFCVLRDRRRNGAGRMVMQLIEKYYKTLGIEKIELDAKCSSQEFYENCGYKVISERFVEADVLHVKMLKEI